MFKNDKERKAWLESYRDWGVWYVDEHIGATYYKYDFDNGARLIVEEYPNPGNEYVKPYSEAYYHLVGGPRPPKGSRRPWVYHETYDRGFDAVTYLVNFLKSI